MTREIILISLSSAPIRGAKSTLPRGSQEIEMIRLTPMRGSMACLLTLAIALTSLLSTSIVSAQYCSPDQCDECNLWNACLKCCHELPELWVINTRCVSRCNNLDEAFEKIRYKRYDASCGRFVTESRESFLAAEASMPTLFYSHGNTLKHKGAMKSFWQVYHRMRCCPGPKRLVCWSWPAQRVVKGLRIRKMIMANLRLKLVYAEYQGYYMAKLIQQMSMSQRVMLSGHSYGAISASTAAHWLGGGQLRGLTLAGGEPVERPNFRLGLISGAFDNDALYPGCRYGQAFVAAEKVLLTRNARDSTLKIWPKVSYRGRRALGVTGLNVNRLGQYRDKMCQVTMTADVRKSHYLTPHLKSTRFVAMLCCLAFPECQEILPLADEAIHNSIEEIRETLPRITKAMQVELRVDSASLEK
jgi:hypothetical protein